MRSAVLAMVAALTFVTVHGQSKPSKPPPADVGPGHVAWFDIATTSLTQSQEFYGTLFDWQFVAVQGTDQAKEIVSRGTPIGTIRVADGQISAFNGVVYVQVADIVASCTRAKNLGATVAPGFPFNLPDRPGAICLIVDPAGHPMGMYSRTPMAPAKPRAQALPQSPE
jgi:predicted enzyme related to lactoylglutathione lyase